MDLLLQLDHLFPNLSTCIYSHMLNHIFILISSHPPPQQLRLTQLFLASTMSKPGKQLRDLLQEQQEPLILETHLKKRGCLEKSSSSERGSGCCRGDSSKLTRRPSSCGPRFFKGIPHCFKILRPILYRLVSIAGNPKRRLYDHDGCVMSFPEMGRKSQKVAEQQQDGSTYASITTMFNSWCTSDTDDSFVSQKIHNPYSTATTIESLRHNKLREEEVNTDRRVQGRSKKHRLQLEPVSVLGGSSVEQSNARTRKKEKSSRWKYGFCNRAVRNSVSLLELFVQSPNEKPRYRGVTELQELVWSNSASQCFKSKRVLEQGKKLLFDCVREAVEAHRRKERKRQPLGPEGIEQLVCQKIKEWEKHSGNEININHLLNMDFVASTQDWNDLKTESREVGLDVGEAILEEMVNEMVTETMNFT